MLAYAETLPETNKARVISIASGKGGVGKTNITINLGIALSNLGYRVCLFDADMGLANIDVLLNLKPLRNLSHVIDGECGLKDIVITGPSNIKIVPASSGVRKMCQLTQLQQTQLIHEFNILAENIDVLLVDNSSGISDAVLNFCAASDERLVVLNNDPASFADSYALIKTLVNDYQQYRFRVVVNKVQSQYEAKKSYERLLNVTDKYLEVSLRYAGFIPQDENILQAARERQAFLLNYSNSKAANSFLRLASQIDSWPCNKNLTGKVQFFIDTLVKAPNNVHPFTQVYV